MSEAAILERRERSVAESDRLNSKVTKEIEALLETSERSHTEKAPASGRWYFRMPQAGVRYYSF